MLRAGIAESDLLLAMIGDHWLEAGKAPGTRRLDDPNDFVRFEIESALERGVPVVPVLVGSAPMPQEHELPAGLKPLAFRMGIVVRPDPDFHAGVDLLIARIETVASEQAARRSREFLGGFGSYQVLSPLAGASMGSAFLAEDSRTGRRVVLKAPDLAAKDRARFLERARAAKGLRHPSLCPVLDVGEIDGHPYLVMELIQGKSLAQTIPAEGTPVRPAAALVGRLALAMKEAHERGVLHGELTAANIRFRPVGQGRDPVIVGLGRGDDESGPIADVVGLGTVLRQLLEGRPAGSEPRNEPGPRAVEPALAAICRRATDRASADRYLTMSEFASALADYLHSPPARRISAGVWGRASGIEFES